MGGAGNDLALLGGRLEFGHAAAVVAATLFIETVLPVSHKGGSRQPLGYRRFATAAEAIRFAVEEFPAVHALGATMQVGDERHDGDGIQRLYESDKYPLRRHLLD